MTDPVPPQAITAGAEALGKYKPRRDHNYLREAARAVLEAAAPHLAAAERERCAQLAEQVALLAAEEVWPHDPPKRDPASTTSATTTLATPPRTRHMDGLPPQPRRLRHPFGIGKDVPG